MCRAVRLVEHAAQAAQPVGRRRDLRAAAPAPLGKADREGELDWLVSVDSTIVRAHQHAAGARREDVLTVPEHTGGLGRITRIGPVEPDKHALGRSRGGWTTKTHLACDGKGRPLSMVATAGNVNDTTVLEPVLTRSPCRPTAARDGPASALSCAG
jgi:hypothetical protein